MISVITVSWNAQATIQSTLKSIINQNSENFEIVIVDGGSNDNTVLVVKELLESSGFDNSRFTIVSEPDHGVYDAMNKGVRLSKGEYVLFMNCGDRFFNNEVISNFERAIGRGENADVYYGNTLMEFYEGTGVFHDDESTPRNRVMPFIHQSAITKRSMLLEHPFDLQYRICADFDLYYWMRNKGCRFIHEDFIVSCYDAKEGLSENNPLLIRRENDRIRGIDKTPHYGLRKIIQRCTIGLIQPIKDYAPRWLLNYYFRKKKTYIEWVEE